MSSAHTVSHMGQVLPGVFTLLLLRGAVNASSSGGGATGGPSKVRDVWILTRCQGLG